MPSCSSGWLPLSSPPTPQAQCKKASTRPQPLRQPVLVRFVILARVTDTKQYLTGVLTRIPLTTEEFLIFGICLLAFWVSSSTNFLFMLLACFKQRFLSLCCYFAEVLYIFSTVVVGFKHCKCILPNVTSINFIPINLG